MKKNGKTLKRIQRHLCKRCGSTKQEEYRNRACLTETNTNIVLLLKEENAYIAGELIVSIENSTVSVDASDGIISVYNYTFGGKEKGISISFQVLTPGIK